MSLFQALHFLHFCCFSSTVEGGLEAAGPLEAPVGAAAVAPQVHQAQLQVPVIRGPPSTVCTPALLFNWIQWQDDS